MKNINNHVDNLTWLKLEDWNHLPSRTLSEFWRWWCIAELDRGICLPITLILSVPLQIYTNAEGLTWSCKCNSRGSDWWNFFFFLGKWVGGYFRIAIYFVPIFFHNFLMKQTCWCWEIKIEWSMNFKGQIKGTNSTQSTVPLESKQRGACIYAPI